MLPTRATLALILTAAGLVLLLAFKTPDDPTLTRNGRAAAATDRPAAVATPAPGRSTGPSANGSGSGSGSDGSAGSGSGSGSTGSGSASGTYDGAVIPTRYGDVQVEVKMRAGRIADVVALQLPSDRARSEMISQYAEPILRTEALKVQSAQIDIVSGATYTSDGYAQSLQAALDQAHA